MINAQKVLCDMICTREFVTPVPMKAIRGHIPQDIRGTYFKVGPAWRDIDDHHVIHPLDGDGYITKVVFDNGQATFQGRYTCGESLMGTRSRTQKARTFSGPFFSLAGLYNPLNTNIIKWNDRLVVFYEGGAPKVVNESDLGIAPGDFLGFKDGWPLKTGTGFVDRFLRGMGVIGDCINAHPKITADGSLVLMKICYHVDGMTTNLTFFVVNGTGGGHINDVTTVPVQVPDFVYMHDFMTIDAHVFAFFHHPLKMSWSLEKGVATCLEDANMDSTLYIVSARGGWGDGDEGGEGGGDDDRVIKIPLKGMQGFVTHHVSCKFMDDEKRMLEILTIWYPGYMRGEGRLMKLVVDTNKRVLVDKSEVGNGKWIEFPVTGADGTIYATCGIVHPMEEVWGSVKGHAIAGEVIISEPAVAGGSYVLLYVYNIQEQKTSLMIYDTSSMTVLCELMCEESPFIPLGLHGMFIASPSA